MVLFIMYRRILALKESCILTSVCVSYDPQNKQLLFPQGRWWGWPVVRPPRAAESKGQENEYFKLKKLTLCAQQILNY
jgi:hypothetical protein